MLPAAMRCSCGMHGRSENQGSDALYSDFDIMFIMQIKIKQLFTHVTFAYDLADWFAFPLRQGGCPALLLLAFSHY